MFSLFVCVFSLWIKSKIFFLSKSENATVVTKEKPSRKVISAEEASVQAVQSKLTRNGISMILKQSLSVYLVFVFACDNIQ